MHAVSNTVQALGAVVYRECGADIGEKGLSRANIGRSLVPADVLLPSLQRESVGGLISRVLTHANEPARHLPLEGLSRRKKSCMRPSKSHRNPKPLIRSNDHIG